MVIVITWLEVTPASSVTVTVSKYVPAGVASETLTTPVKPLIEIPIFPRSGEIE